MFCCAPTSPPPAAKKLDPLPDVVARATIARRIAVENRQVYVELVRVADLRRLLADPRTTDLAAGTRRRLEDNCDIAEITSQSFAYCVADADLAELLSTLAS